MKKKYKKPLLIDSSGQGVSTGAVPAALAAGAALAGGYIIGRVVKQIEIRTDCDRLNSLERVYC